jgi:hypothetical protein
MDFKDLFETQLYNRKFCLKSYYFLIIVLIYLIYFYNFGTRE